MIKTETAEGKTRTYSDAGFLIRNEATGEVFSEAIDLSPAPVYLETAERIPDPADSEIPDSLAMAILSGEVEV